MSGTTTAVTVLDGETNFVNSRGGGGGGFNWSNVDSNVNATPTVLM